MYTRTDISLEERIEIFNQGWRYGDEQGFISGLAQQWQVSRHFVYNLIEKVEQALGWQKPGPKQCTAAELECEQLAKRVVELADKCNELAGKLAIAAYDEQVRRQALLLELALCPVSEDKIARCLRVAFGSAPSTGWINEQLNAAGKAALAVMTQPQVTNALTVAALDELFAANKPILTLVNPHTLMMAMPQLADNRQATSWQQVLKQYPNLNLAVSDQARGLLKGVQLSSAQIAQQADLFHFRRNLQRYIKRLEHNCYRSIEQLDYAERLRHSPRLIISARIQAEHEYQYKRKAVDNKLLAFDWLETIISYLMEGISIFDERRQSIRSYQQGQAIICEVLELLDGITEFSVKQIVTLIEGARTTLLTFLTITAGKLAKVKVDWRIIEGSREALFAAIARVWHWRKLSGNNEQNLRQYLTALMALRHWYKRVENFEQVTKQVFTILDQVLRASSAVECINSILRPYISIKKRLNQGFLALIALYWNMRPLAQRGGKTPFQLSGVYLDTDDWIELIQVNQRRLARLAQAA